MNKNKKQKTAVTVQKNQFKAICWKCGKIDFEYGLKIK